MGFTTTSMAPPLPKANMKGDASQNPLKQASSSSAANTLHDTDNHPDRQERTRTSFASFKEERSAIAQSFVNSNVSSYARRGYAEDEAVIDSEFDDSRTSSPQSQSRNRSPVSQSRIAALRAMPADYKIELPFRPLTNPHSALLGVCPCEGFQGWKGINVRGKIASRSFGDLRVLRKRFEWDTEFGSPSKKIKTEVGPGCSRVESLPTEILGKLSST